MKKIVAASKTGAATLPASELLALRDIAIALARRSQTCSRKLGVGSFYLSNSLSVAFLSTCPTSLPASFPLTVAKVKAAEFRGAFQALTSDKLNVRSYAN